MNRCPNQTCDRPASASTRFAWRGALCLGLASLVVTGVPDALAAQASKRVLFVGIDGIRPDSLAEAQTPQLDQLVDDGLLVEPVSILPDRYTISDTVSHSSWSTILTGTWPDKHGVRTNEWNHANFRRYPHLFVHLKRANRRARTAVFTAGPAIADNIPAHSDLLRVERLDAPKSQRAFLRRDERVTDAALAEIRTGDPTAVFLYYYEPDWAGHESGFSSENANYLRAIENIDRHVGKLVAEIAKRSTRDAEDWLIVVCTDHGGLNSTHRNGHQYREITDVFLILSGQSVHRPADVDDPRIVDIAPTILAHLGVELDPAWELDGNPIDLSEAPPWWRQVIGDDTSERKDQ